MTTVNLNANQICAIHSWPFPCEEGKILDPTGVLHFHGFDVVFPDQSGGATVVFSAANRSVSADDRLQLLELAAGVTISRAMTVQRAADTVEGAGSAVFSANQSAIGKFVDGLVASPPVIDLGHFVPGTYVLGGIIIVIKQPPPIHPEWKDGELLSGIDLLSIGSRFRSAAASIDAGPLREEFVAAGNRLFEAGAERLETNAG